MKVNLLYGINSNINCAWYQHTGEHFQHNTV